LHHSTQPSHKLDGAYAVVHVSNLCRWRESRTWPVPQFFSLMRRLATHQPCDARHETNAIFTTWCCTRRHHYQTSMGRRFSSIFSERHFSSLLVHVPLIPAFLIYLVLSFFLASDTFLFCPFYCTTRPDQVFSLQHLWEVCMSGILTEDGKHSLTAHEVRHSRIVFLFSCF
jgi:hypothetical protein